MTKLIPRKSSAVSTVYTFRVLFEKCKVVIILVVCTEVIHELNFGNFKGRVNEILLFSDIVGSRVIHMFLLHDDVTLQYFLPAVVNA